MKKKNLLMVWVILSEQSMIFLWDLSASTAAFYKAALANVILDKQWVPRDSWKWRLLQIRFDGLNFLERAPTINDLIGRRSALQSALDDVRKLLEETYPLGNEVYRDENGSAFVMSALNGDDAEGNQLRGLIEGYILDTLRQSELGGELRPQIYITKPHKQAAMLHEALAKPPPPVVSFQDSLSCWWQGEAADICTVCGVRPQGWGAPDAKQKGKAQERNVCYVCLERRGRRAEKWARARHEKEEDKSKLCRPPACCADVPQGVHHEKEEDKSKPWECTLWLDEVADKNGRLALIVGKFDLAQWLNGEMVQTLLVVSRSS